MRTASAAAAAAAMALAASTTRSEVASCGSTLCFSYPGVLSVVTTIRGGAHQHVPPPGGGEGSSSDNTRASTTTTTTAAQPNTHKGKKKNRGKKSTRKSAFQLNKPPANNNTSTTSGDTTTAKKESSSTTTTTRKNETPPLSPQETLIQELINEEDYYKILGVRRSATATEIQKAYRRRAVQTHPDKVEGHDRRAFDKVAEAYHVLSDDTKRQTYNRFGKRGVDVSQEEGRPRGSFTEDILRNFFGSSPSSSGYNNNMNMKPRNRTVRYQLEVTLEELYNGSTKNVIITEPGRKKVQVHVEKGTMTGSSIVMPGEMDHVENDTPADIVFIVHQRPHPHFTRKGHDLAMELTVTLQQAICGMTTSIRHLDGRRLTISSARHVFGNGDSSSSFSPMLIQTGDVHVLKGEGMPKPNSHQEEFGDLYIQYRVEMPTQHAVSGLSTDERQQLSTLLGKLQPGKKEDKNVDSKNIKVLQKASPSDFGRASGAYRMPVDEEEEEVHYHDFHSRQFPRQFYFSGGNPFGGTFGRNRDYQQDDANVQCQQM